MRLWGIADTHLSFGVDKPMDVFGPRWAAHAERMGEAWRRLVQPEDTVIVPGDISWAMTLEEALPDLQFLHELPGQVLIGRGNHDYWWSTLKKMNEFAEEHSLSSLTFMKNDAYLAPLSRGRRAVVTNSRGWVLPGDPEFTAQDRKVYDREIGRIKMSLTAGKKLQEEDDLFICSLHYPPLSRNGQDTPISELMEEFQVETCIYGHVHGIGSNSAYAGERNGVNYINVASDYLSFEPLLLAE